MHCFHAGWNIQLNLTLIDGKLEKKIEISKYYRNLRLYDLTVDHVDDQILLFFKFNTAPDAFSEKRYS